MEFSSQDYLERLRMEQPDFFQEAISLGEKEDPPEHGAWNVVSQFADGFINGFTTLDVGAEPVTGAERISRSLGHLLGFVGYIPGPGILGKLGTTGLARGSGIIARSIRGSQFLKPNLIPGQLGGIAVKSFPMLGADLIMDGLKSSVGKMAIMDSFKLAGGKQIFGRTVRDLVEGGLHLGFASAVSARPFYQMELDDRWKAFWEGAPAGAAFRLMGNAVNRGGLVDLTRLAGLGESAGRRANAIARAFSGAAMMGLPATMREEPMELQLYEYLLGAYFGGMEMSSSQRRVLRDLAKYRSGKHPYSSLMDVEKLEEWKTWNDVEREEAKYQSEMEVGKLIQAGVDGFQYATPAFLARARAEYDTVSQLLEEHGGNYNVVAEMMKVHPAVVRRIVLGERIGEKMEDRSEELRSLKDSRLEETIEPLPRGDSGETLTPLTARIEDSFTEAERREIFQRASREVAEATRAEEDQAESSRESVSMFYQTLEKVLKDHATFEGSEIHHALENSDVNSSLFVPLSRLTERLASAYKPAEGLPGKSRAEVRSDIYEIAKETLSGKGEGANGFEMFRTRLETKYDFTLTADDVRPLKEMWNFVRVAKPISLVEWVVGEGMKELKEVNALGVNVDKYAAESPIEGILRGRTLRLESIRKGETTPGSDVARWVIDSIYKGDTDGKGEQTFPWHKVLLWSAMSDAPFISGVKDTPALLFGKWVDELSNPAERTANTEVVLSRLRELAIDGRSGAKAYEDGLREFLGRFPEKEGYLEISEDQVAPKDIVKGAFDSLWAQNLLLLEKLNGGKIPFEDILTNKGGKFVNTWVDFNKRMQVLATGAIPVEESAIDIPDVRKHDGLRTVIAKATGYADDVKTWERELDRKTNLPTGFAELRPSETSRDGGVFLRRDVFDTLMMWAAGDPLAGFEKSHAFHVDETQGAFISKRGVHKADSAMDKWMQENELHAVEFTTTAKQRGRRKVTGVSYDASSGTHRLDHSLEDVAFTMPVSAIRHNATTRETVASQLKEQNAVVQMFYNITIAQGGSKAIQDIAREVLIPAWRGKDETNARVRDLLLADDAAQRASLDEAKLDIDEVDGASLLKILRGSDARPTRLWKHLFEQLFGRYDEARSAADDEGVTSETYAEYSHSVAEIRSAADKLFALWEESPLTAMNPITDRMFDTVLWSYLRERVTSPRVANSMKSYILPHSPMVRAKYGTEPGSFMLGSAARSKEITLKGETHTLGEIWDVASGKSAGFAEGGKLSESDARAFLSEDFYVVRVPSDSASGTRTLRFKGFVEEVDGTGILLHDLDMRAVGGADTDGDSAFLYHSGSLPRSMHEFYSRPEIQTEWYEDLPTRDGGKAFVMKDALETKELQQGETPLSRASKDPLSFGNPLVGLYTNRSAAVANSQLGPGLSLMRSILTTLDVKLADGGTNDEILKTAKTARDYKRAVVNGAADASGGRWLKPQREIRKLMEEMSGIAPEEADRLSKLTAILKGYDNDWQRPYTIDETAHLLNQDAPGGVEGVLPLTKRETNSPDGKVRVPYPNLWFYAADVLSRGLEGLETSPWLLVDRAAVEAKHDWLREMMQNRKGANDAGIKELLRSVGRFWLSNAPNNERFSGDLALSGQEAFPEGVERGESGRYTWTLPERLEYDKLPRYLKDQFTRHMVFQDAMDVATAKVVHGVWARWTEGLDPEGKEYADVRRMARRIRDEVERVKFLEKRRQEKSRSESVESGLMPAASTFDSHIVSRQLDGEPGADPSGRWWKPEAKWIGYKNLSQVAQVYYSAYAAGSIFQQRTGWPRFIREWRESFTLPEGVPPESRLADDLREAHDKKGANAWHDRSWNASGLKLPFISQEAVKMLGTAMHEFFYRPAEKEDFRRWLLEERKVPLAEKLSGPDVRELRHNLGSQKVQERYIEILRLEAAKRSGHTLFTDGGAPKGEAAQEKPEVGAGETAHGTPTYAEKLKALAAVKALDPKVETEIQDMADELSGVMQKYPWLIRYFDGLFAGVTAEQNAYGVGTSIQSATMKELGQFMYEMNRKRLTGPKDGKPGRPVPWYAHFLWPDKIDSYLVAWDTKVIPNERRMVFEGGKVQEQTTYSLISHQGYLSNLAGRVITGKDDEVNRLRQQLHDRLSELFHLPGEAANDFFRYAQAARERARDYAEKTKDGRYQTEYREALKEMNEKYGSFPLTRMERGMSIPVRPEEVLGRAVQMQSEWADSMKKLIRDEELEVSLLSGALEKDGFLNMRALVGKLTKDPEFPAFTWNILKRMREWQIILRLPVKVREDAFGVAKVRPHVWDEAKRTVDGDRVAYREVTLGDIEDLAYRRMMYRRLRADRDVNVNGWMSFRDIELMEASEYFPHLGWPEKVWKEHYEAGRKDVAGNVEPWRLAKELEGEIERMQTLTTDGGMGSYLNEALLSTGMTQKDIVEAGLARIPRSFLHRTDEGGSVPGYDKTPRAFGLYQKQISEARWNLLYSIISHETIRSFERERPLGDHTEAWAAFMRTEVQSILGAPSIYPREWLNNPAFRIKNSPYWFFTDQHWMDLAKALGIRFGKGESSLINVEKLNQDATVEAERILGKIIRKETVTPDEAHLVDSARKGRLLELSRKLADAKMTARLAWLSNLEAKYQLITLLSHTKTATANVFGGSLNSIISAGFEPWRRAGNYQYIKDKVFQGMDEIRSMKDVEAFVEKHGGVESFVNELAARGVAPASQLRAFFDDVQAKAVAKPGDILAKTTLAELVKKHGLSERMMDWASVFMRVSERAVRRRSWMAHYLRARDVLDVNGVQVEADHPWLIEMARRGTEASQFLYNNAARPVFARTSAGKVFSRFQLWAWNSIKFRNEIYARARIGGFTPGSPEFDRFQRMVLADLFVMGLAGLFPTSLFGASMPPPYSYMQDLSAYFFGDDREKDRAFYGTLPYPLNITKLGMPPAARMLDPVFIAMTGGDWDKFASNTVWTYFPFGRLAKGLSLTIENPTLVAENLFGVPLHKWQSRLKNAPHLPLISNVVARVGVEHSTTTI